MAKNTDLTEAQAVQLVSDFHATLATAKVEEQKSSKAFNVDKRDKLYARLADAFGRSLQLTADAKVLGLACAHYKVAPPGKNENPHSAVVRMLWRIKDAETGKMVPDTSAWKYGKGFRAAQSLGWTAADYAVKLAEYDITVKDPKTGNDKKIGGHAALEALDTKNNGNPEGAMAAHEQLAAIAWMGQVEKPLASFIGDLVEAPKHRQMVGLVAQFSADDGAWHVRAINQPDSDRAWSTIAKKVTARFSKWRSEMALKQASKELERLAPEDITKLLAEAAKQNREVEVREAERSLTRKLVVFEREGDFAFPREVDAITSSDDAANDQLSEAA